MSKSLPQRQKLHCDKCGYETERGLTRLRDCLECRRHIDKSGFFMCLKCNIETKHDKRAGCSVCIKNNRTMCLHGRRRDQCYYCHTVEEIQRLRTFCRVCCAKRMSNQRRRAGVTMCAECDPSSPTRIELILRPKFVEILGPYNIADEFLGTGGGCGNEKSTNKPDLLWLTCDDGFENIRALVIEVDEDSHSDRDVTCEAKRISQQFVYIQSAASQQYGSADVRVLFLRYNPDAYDGPRTSGEDRIKNVAAVGDAFLHGDTWRVISPLAPHLMYFYYHSRGQKHIDHMRNNPDACVVI